ACSIRIRDWWKSRTSASAWPDTGAAGGTARRRCLMSLMPDRRTNGPEVKWSGSAAARGSLRGGLPASAGAGRAGGGRTLAVGVVGDEVAHLRVHLLAPAAAAEDAVMAGGDGQVGAVALGDRAAKVMRGAGLAEAGDVVELALDGHQRGV